jgi:hypothetical protein
MMFLFFVVVLTVSSVGMFSHARVVADTDDYTIWRIPDDAPDDASGMTTFPGVSLNGGGTDVDAAFEWMSINANKGDFLVLRTSGSDGYNDYIYELSQAVNSTLSSVTSILCKNRKASYSDVVLSYVRNAEAIFFAGGDQSRYVNDWYNTPLQTAVQQRVNSQVSVGGTSAGLAILGTRVYRFEFTLSLSFLLSYILFSFCRARSLSLILLSPVLSMTLYILTSPWKTLTIGTFLLLIAF